MKASSIKTCDIRCKTSVENKHRCTCSCGGKNHGSQAGIKFGFTPVMEGRQCYWCRLPLHYEGGEWRHPGGQRYVMECPECNWMGEAPTKVIMIDTKVIGAPQKPTTDICPGCGVQGKLRNNHWAMPGRQTLNRNQRDGII
jgi:hypothetical protein